MKNSLEFWEDYQIVWELVLDEKQFIQWSPGDPQEYEPSTMSMIEMVDRKNNIKILEYND